MTREEAISRLKNMAWIYGSVEREQNIEAIDMAIDMAIESLSAEPTDLISRADAIKAVHKYFMDLFNDEPHETDEDGDEVFTDMKSVNTLLNHNKAVSKAIKALPSADRPSGEWKLASEELPQSVGSYIVTCKDEHGWVYIDYDYWTVADRFKYNCSKVIAWIPFPKPCCGTKMKTI